MTKKAPFVQRISERIVHRLESEGIDGACRYGIAVLSANRQHARKVISCIPPEVGVLISKHFEVKASIQRDKNRAQAAVNAAHDLIAKTKNDVRLSELQQQVESARRSGQAVALLCTLPTEDRNALGTKEEIRLVIAAQKETVKTGAVREALQCTLTELNRWTLDGRLPYLFKRNIQTQNGTVEARFWRVSDVDVAKEQCFVWREEDKKRNLI